MMSTGSRTPAAFVPKYELDYQEAQKLYEEEKFEDARDAAEYNLTDPTLPRYYLIKNHMLWAHAADLYEETEEHRLIAEEVYQDADELTPKSARDEQVALQSLRVELDHLARCQQEDQADSDGMKEKASAIETGNATVPVPSPGELEVPLRGKAGNGKGKHGVAYVDKKDAFDVSEYLGPGDSVPAMISDPRSVRKKKNASSSGARSLSSIFNKKSSTS